MNDRSWEDDGFPSILPGIVIQHRLGRHFAAIMVAAITAVILGPVGSYRTASGDDTHAGESRDTRSRAQTDQDSAEPVSLTSIRNCARELLKLEATIGDGVDHDQAMLSLCDLYVMIRQDRRFNSSEMLKQDATKLRRRLLTIQRRRAAELRRGGIQRPPSLSADVDSAVAEAFGDQSGGSDAIGDSNDLGRPLSFTAAGAFAAGGAFDNGWQLVELIQRIVAPDFWSSRGGPGTIRYFAIRRVLVVSATTDVHEQIRDLLKSLSR